MTADDTTIASPIDSTSSPNVPFGDLVLRFLNTEHAGQWVRLEPAKCSIGANESCTLCLRTRFVQPLHALIVRGRERTVVRTYAADSRINGRPFESAMLTPGDTLSLGTVDFQVAALHFPPDHPTDRFESAAIEAELPSPRSDEQRQQEIEHALQSLTRAKQVNRARTRRLISDLRDANERLIEQHDRLAESNRRGEQLESRLNLLEERLAQLQHEYATASEYQTTALPENLATREVPSELIPAELEASDALDRVAETEATSSGRQDESHPHMRPDGFDGAELCEDFSCTHETSVAVNAELETMPDAGDWVNELGLPLTTSLECEVSGDATSFIPNEDVPDRAFSSEPNEQHNDANGPQAPTEEHLRGAANQQSEEPAEQSDQWIELRSHIAELFSDEQGTHDNSEQAGECVASHEDEYASEFLPEYTASDPWTPATATTDACGDNHDSTIEFDTEHLEIATEPSAESMSSLSASDGTHNSPISDESFSEEVNSAAVESPAIGTSIGLAQDDGEESIEAYMARLMQRVRRENEAVSLAPSRIAPPPSEQPVSAATSKSACEETKVFEKAFAHEIDARQREFSSPNLMRRSEAPENRDELAVMRELANTSARSAIRASQQRRDTQVVALQVSGAIIAMFTGAGLFGLANSLLSLTSFAAFACWTGAGYLVYRTIALYRSQSVSTKTSSQDAAVDAAIVPSDQVDNPILVTSTQLGENGSSLTSPESAIELPIQAESTTP